MRQQMRSRAGGPGANELLKTAWAEGAASGEMEARKSRRPEMNWASVDGSRSAGLSADREVRLRIWEACTYGEPFPKRRLCTGPVVPAPGRLVPDGAPVGERWSGSRALQELYFRLGRCIRLLEPSTSIDKACVASGQSSVLLV